MSMRHYRNDSGQIMATITTLINTNKDQDTDWSTTQKHSHGLLNGTTCYNSTIQTHVLTSEKHSDAGFVYLLGRW